MDSILAYDCTLMYNQYFLWVVATRQISKNGKVKSPRVQVVLPEELCQRLASLAEKESRTVSNMAKVLIQKGVKQYEQESLNKQAENSLRSREGFISALETQETKRLRGAPRRLRFYKPS